MLDDESHSDEKKGGEVRNIFQRGSTVRRGRGTGLKVTSRKLRDESKKPRVEAKKSKYKSTVTIHTDSTWTLIFFFPHLLHPDSLLSHL